MMQTEKGVTTGQAIFPFKHLFQAISYFNEHNPCRAVTKNPLETETKSKPIIDDFTGESPKDIWASLLAGIRKTLNDARLEHAHVWVLHNYGPRGSHLALETIAWELYGKRKEPRTLRRWCANINDELTAEFVRRGLLPPESETPHKYPRSPELRDGQPGDEEMPRFRSRFYSAQRDDPTG